LFSVNDQEIKVIVDMQKVPELHLDSGRIRQLIVNLLKNAFEAFNEDSAQRKVSLSVHLEKSAASTQDVVLSVSDTGPGIPPEILQNLFDPYVSSKQKGSGLGLSIVKKIVEEHSARVVAANNPNQGAKISIYFPAEAGGEQTNIQPLKVKHVA
jgi:signal transduction histidine kinase